MVIFTLLRDVRRGLVLKLLSRFDAVGEEEESLARQSLLSLRSVSPTQYAPGSQLAPQAPPRAVRCRLELRFCSLSPGLKCKSSGLEGRPGQPLPCHLLELSFIIVHRTISQPNKSAPPPTWKDLWASVGICGHLANIAP